MSSVSAYAPIPSLPDRTSFTITDLAAEFDVTPRALRFYEDEGLIAPERRGRTRLFRPADRHLVRQIIRGRRLGFSVAEMREIIQMYREPPGEVGQRLQGRHTQRAVTIERCRARIATLEAQKQDIDAAIEELGEFVALLETGATREA